MTHTLPFHLLYPERRTVYAAQIISWYLDQLANGDVEDEGLDPKSPADIDRMAIALDDAGFITLGK